MLRLQAGATRNSGFAEYFLRMEKARKRDSVDAKLLAEWCEKIGVSIGGYERRQVLTYLNELIAWNRKMNLVAKASSEQILRKHFIDSLTCSSLLPDQQSLRLLDIGTGGGFPGLVLKIIRPDIVTHLLEASEKKCVFLRHIVSILELDGVRVLSGRAEDFGHMDGYRESYDITIARAVGHLSIISEYAFPFLRLEGLFIAQKGSRGMDEFEEARDALKVLGGKLEEIKRLVLPGGRERRVIFAFRKEKATPAEYPRRKGVPAKRPIRAVKEPRRNAVAAREAVHAVKKSRATKCLVCGGAALPRTSKGPYVNVPRGTNGG